MPGRRGGRAAVLALAASLLVGGCAAPTHPPAVRMELVQLRGDVATGHVELRVTNESDAPLTVERATYVSSRWDAPMVRANRAEIAPGQRRNLRLLLPEPTCDPAPVEHRATLELADGTVLEAVPEDALGRLESLDAPECDLRAFEQQVAALTWLEPVVPADGSGPALLRLEVAPASEPGERAGELAGSIDAIDATVLLTPVDASGSRLEVLPIELPIARGGEPSVVEVPLGPGRCDAHAIAEDKQGTIFRVRATMRGEPMDLVLVSPDAQRHALLDWVVARCATEP